MVILRYCCKMPRGARRRSSRQLRWTPYPIPSRNLPEEESLELEEREEWLESLELEEREKRVWEDAICPVCLEYPHQAVLLVCSSHDNGCRPYMCGTSYRHSNCLDQFKKACTRVTSTTHHHGWDLFRWFARETEVMELACPLCRGQVEGWARVKPARKYLNTKKRSCMQDNCSFVGRYSKLRNHARSEHPCAKPHEVEEEGGDDNGHDEGGGSHGIGRSILYFLREGLRVVLREVALVMELYEENSSSEDSEEDDDVYAHEENSSSEDSDSSSEDSEEDDDVYTSSVNGAGAVAGAADITTTADSHGRGAEI